MEVRGGSGRSGRWYGADRLAVLRGVLASEEQEFVPCYCAEAETRNSRCPRHGNDIETPEDEQEEIETRDSD